MVFNFHIPTKLVYGNGALSTIGANLGGSFSRALIVADEVAFNASGAKRILSKQLARMSVEIYNGVQENPPLESLGPGAMMAKDLGAEIVIGVGGGSAMDTAKGIAVLCTNSGPMNSYLSGTPLERDPLPVVCIPTTSGTGSEATPFAVFTGASNKQGLAHPGLYPALSIIDPELTFSMPRALVIDTGLDALAHAIEAYLSLDASPMSDVLAYEAAQRVIANLEAASNGDHVAQAQMAFASTTAGMAIAHAGTILPHIMGYPLTFLHGIHHGQASAILLPAFLEFLGKSSPGNTKVKIIESLFAKFGGPRNYLKGFGLAATLEEYGIKSNEFETFADMTIVKDDIKITPAEVTKEAIIRIYQQSFK